MRDKATNLLSRERIMPSEWLTQLQGGGRSVSPSLLLTVLLRSGCWGCLLAGPRVVSWGRPAGLPEVVWSST